MRKLSLGAMPGCPEDFYLQALPETEHEKAGSAASFKN
jgi:hypothetical protein